ncbi:MAG: hypothetical protein KA746_05830 [Pyrinomonadaceae bacterium]|nr:hypothetical protein [Pyrinomonadaceae bacterium]
MKVKFVPRLADYMFIAESLQAGRQYDVVLRWVYSIFLLINSIVFPAYLFLNEKLLVGVGIFLFNLAAYFVLTSVYWNKRISRTFEERYRHLLEDPIEVELSNAGVIITHLGNSSIAIWKNFTHVEETDESIYYYFTHNALFVRKDAFDSPRRP